MGKRKRNADNSCLPSSSDNMLCSSGKKLLFKELEAVDLHHEPEAVKDAKVDQTTSDLTPPEPRDPLALECYQKKGKRKKKKHLEETQETFPLQKRKRNTNNISLPSSLDNMPCSSGKKLLFKEFEAADLHHELEAVKNAKLNQSGCDLTQPEPRVPLDLGCCQKKGKRKKKKHLESQEPLSEVQAGIFAEKINPGCSHSEATNGSKETMNVIGRSVREKKPPVFQPDKKLLVLDINGLLADILSGPPPKGFRCDLVVSNHSVFMRPFCSDFLCFCFKKFHVGVWSSRAKKKLDKIIPFVFGSYKQKLLFRWDNSHCTKTGLFTVEQSTKLLLLKELRKLWEQQPEKGVFNETNTLLLDDSPYKALRNPVHTAIFPYPYTFRDGDDSSLGPGGDLREYLEGLADAENVQEYVSKHPFGQKAITDKNPSWGFYRKIIEDGSSRPE